MKGAKNWLLDNAGLHDKKIQGVHPLVFVFYIFNVGRG
jgi:hypothetical protein